MDSSELETQAAVVETDFAFTQYAQNLSDVSSFAKATYRRVMWLNVNYRPS